MPAVTPRVRRRYGNAPQGREEMGDLRYERPGTVAEATALLAAGGGAARVLAGGTDLVLALRGGLPCDVLVDVKHIPELGRVAWTADGGLEIGACVLVQDVAEDDRIRRAFPALAEGAEAIGSLQIRHRATVAGNLSNASPCMDTAPPLLVLDGRLRVVGPEGTREAPLADFFVGVKETALGRDELVTAVRVPKPAAGLRCGFDKVKRTWGHDLALVNARQEASRLLEDSMAAVRAEQGAQIARAVAETKMQLAGEREVRDRDLGGVG
mgnify:CR=1 FL=1